MNQEIKLALSETIAWSNLKFDISDPASNTRSKELKPDNYSGEGYDLIIKMGSSAKLINDMVMHVIINRRKILKELKIELPIIDENLCNGRILYSTIDSDLCFCAGEPSKGFFDDHDLPGWDTWFVHGIHDASNVGAIYCWVPNELIEFADAGLETLPCYNVMWLEGNNINPY